MPGAFLGLPLFLGLAPTSTISSSSFGTDTMIVRVCFPAFFREGGLRRSLLGIPSYLRDSTLLLMCWIRLLYCRWGYFCSPGLFLLHWLWLRYCQGCWLLRLAHCGTLLFDGDN